MQENHYIVKLTAYTTTCKVMFQPVDMPVETKVVPSNKSVPRYFVDNFFLPWCEQAYTQKNYDEKALMEAVNNEI